MTIVAACVSRENKTILDTVLEYFLLREEMVVKQDSFLWPPEVLIAERDRGTIGQLAERDKFEPPPRIFDSVVWELNMICC